MSCDCSNDPSKGINVTSGIPVKEGFPLSTACERATIIGSIPEVIRFPNFTLVRGGTVVNRISSAGITNMASFFKTRTGCFYDKDGQVSGCLDCPS